MKSKILLVLASMITLALAGTACVGGGTPPVGDEESDETSQLEDVRFSFHWFNFGEHEGWLSPIKGPPMPARVDVNIQLNVYNPNDIEVVLESIDYGITMGNTLVGEKVSTNEYHITIAPYEGTKIWTTFCFKPEWDWDVLSAVVKGNIGFLMKGTADTASSQGPRSSKFEVLFKIPLDELAALVT